jgi:predicted RNA-binding protein (virulence factor B family)
MRIGEYQTLKITRETQNGIYLADSDAEVLLPRGQCPREIVIGASMTVFVYTDSEDRPIATTKKPKAKVGDFAAMRVVSLTDAGAFLDWGLDKDLFCPIREQNVPMREDGVYVVRVYLDPVSERVTCSSRLRKYLTPTGDGLAVGQKVRIMITGIRRDAIDLIVDGSIKGTLFPDEWHERFSIGDERDAYVKKVRDDGRLAISLRPQGYQSVLAESDRLLKALKTGAGFLPVTDRSSPEEIHRRFGLSKGAFKKLIGTLYREGEIDIESHGIRLKA